MGTKDIDFNKGLMREDVSGIPKLYIELRVEVMICERNVRACETRDFMSNFCPNLSNFVLGTRQRGHGQIPRSRIVAKRTL